MASLANVGSSDKIIRLIGGAIVLALAFLKLGGVASTAGLVATVVGAILILTGLFNFCPAYKIFGIGTNRK